MKKIYLIDDDSEEAELFHDAIARLDNSIYVESFNNGRDALEKLKSEELYPDLIFLDLNMPMFPGKEVLKELRTDPATASVPVVIYSTTISSRDIEETSTYQVKAFIQKPDDFSSLCRKLAEQIGVA